MIRARDGRTRRFLSIAIVYRCCWSWRLDQGTDCLILTGGFWREADIRQNTDYQQELRLPGVAQRELSCEVCHAGVESHKAMLVGRPPIPKETSGCSHDDRRCPLIALGGSERDWISATAAMESRVPFRAGGV